MITAENLYLYEWILLIAFGIGLFWISPWAKTNAAFFRASKADKSPGLWILTSSLVISWIFAKSITNAANLGLKYGMLGGLAYATYYLSFLVAGLIIYNLRTKGGFTSIHQFLSAKFGSAAVVLFSLLIAFRLFNEVWSNTMVIGSYFGTQGSLPYYLSILVFTFLTLAYSIKGGLSSSMFTDAIQMVLFGGLLVCILSILLPHFQGDIFQAEWSLSGGFDLMLVAFIQSFSYPFHDPVMTDRGFITDPRTMKRAFLLAAPIGFLGIELFSFMGIYARQAGMIGDATIQVAQSLGLILTLLINFIMITSASSTLDSAFASFSKLIVIDLRMLKTTFSNGRLIMVAMTLIGTIPIFFDPEILSATTISGSMVIGLAPIFLFWKTIVPKQTFIVVVGLGCLFGVAFTADLFPTNWLLFQSDYGALLSVNIFGTLSCFMLYGVMWFFNKSPN